MNHLKKIPLMFALILMTQEGYMSTVRYEDWTLEKLVLRSSHILVAEKMTPLVTTREVEISPLWKRLIGRGHPSFREITYHFRVLEVLLAGYGESLEGRELKVFPSRQMSNLELHRRYYLEGVRKSTIEYHYKGKADFEKAKKLVLFLRRGGEGIFSFSAAGAWEDPGRVSVIEKLIKEKKSGKLYEQI